MNFSTWTKVLCAVFAGTLLIESDSYAEQANWIIQLQPAKSVASSRAELSATVGREIRIGREYRRAFNGFTAELSDDEAKSLRKLDLVLRIEKDVLLELPNHSEPVRALTASDRQAAASNSSGDPVIDLVQAGAVWDGSATNDSGHLGEGVIVGAVGTGISGNHPSFAATGGDGYTHTNPLGDGVYLGECLSSAEIACNSKLIGRYSLVNDPLITSQEPEGFGNGVAQAVGNRLQGSSFEQLGFGLTSGIAPHANLIVYRTCTQNGCALSSVLAAFEQAINDGVDVLIHYVSSATELPWDSIQGEAALALRDSGVSLSYVTGNQGPAPGTLNLSMAAPWTATFISSTHGRSNTVRVLTDFSGGDTPPPPDLLGGSLSGTLTANIVYAGALGLDVLDANLCLEPFPANTLNGELLVCDRGQISRVQKAINARDSGAGGMVLANVEGGSDSINSDVFVFPGIHLNAADSALLRAWLSSGSNHQASIAYADLPFDSSLADRLSDRNNRGPNQGLDFLAPSAAVPSINVFFPFGESGFAMNSGLASAAGAGALALLKSAKPAWSDAELLSALMTTGVAPLAELDGFDVTGPFDHGGGRIDVAAASQAGLLLNETTSGFQAANPNAGGQPSRMNLAGLVDLNCLQRCSWTRIVTATTSTMWDVSWETAEGTTLTVEPESFSLAEGETQTLSVTFDLGSGTEGAYNGNVVLTPLSAARNPTRLVLSVAAEADSDLDGVSNATDNCLFEANAGQTDSDADGYGNRCDTDLNNDSVTNFLDLALFVERFQTGDTSADFNDDAKVDFSDLAILRDYFLLEPGPSGLL